MYTNISELSNLIHEELQTLLEQKEEWYKDLDAEFQDKYEDAIYIIEQSWFKTGLPRNIQTKYVKITRLYKEFLQWKAERDIYDKKGQKKSKGWRAADSKAQTTRKLVQIQVGELLDILKKAAKAIDVDIRNNAGKWRCDDPDWKQRKEGRLVHSKKEKKLLNQLLNVMKLGNQFLEEYTFYVDPLDDPNDRANRLDLRGGAAVFLADKDDDLRQRYIKESTVKRDKQLFEKLSEATRETQFRLYKYLQDLQPVCPRRPGEDASTQRPRWLPAEPPPAAKPKDEIDLEYGITAPSKRVFQIMQKVWPGQARDKMKMMKLMTPCGQMAQKLQAIQIKIAEKLKSMNYTVTADFNFVKYFHLKWAMNQESVGNIGYKTLHEIIENNDYGNFKVLIYDNNGREKTVNIPPKPSETGLAYYHFLNILEKLQLCNTGASLNHGQAGRIIALLKVIKNNTESIILPRTILNKDGKYLNLNIPEGVKVVEMLGGLNRILMLSNKPLKPKYFLPTRRGAEEGGVSGVPCKDKDGNPTQPIPKGCPGYSEDEWNYELFD